MRKRILRNLGVVVALTTTGSALAQLPEVYPEGHIVTDIHGETYNLDNILESGKALVIDMFWDACGPCWSYHESGVMDEIHENLLYVDVFGLEGVVSTPESAISDAASGYGDWTMGGTIHYPLANDDEISTILGSTSYPTLVLVCPDRSVVEMGQVDFETWKTAILNCPTLVTGIDENETVTSTTIYPNPVTDNATVQFTVNGVANTSIEILNAVGQVVMTKNLGQTTGDQNVTLNTQSLDDGTYIFKITAGENIITKSVSILK